MMSYSLVVDLVDRLERKQGFKDMLGRAERHGFWLPVFLKANPFSRGRFWCVRAK